MFFRNIIFFLAFLHFSPLFAEDTQALMQIQKLLAMQQAEINSLKENSANILAVGSIQQSFLTEDQFQNISGKNWILCDGRNVSGSKYSKITGFDAIPDCRGLFFRSMGGNAESTLGKIQSSDVSLSGVSFSHNLYGTFEKKNFNHSHNANASPSGAHSHEARHIGNHTRTPGHHGWIGNDGTFSNLQTGNVGTHTHNISVEKFEFDGEQRVSVNGSITAKGGRETRPQNITINTFIRID